MKSNTRILFVPLLAIVALVSIGTGRGRPANTDAGKEKDAAWIVEQVALEHFGQQVNILTRTYASEPVRARAFLKKGEKWLKGLKIEVENVSDKSIYFLRYQLILPEITRGGKPVGFKLEYGNPEMRDVTRLAGPQDVPFLPGTKIDLRLPRKKYKALLALIKDNGFSLSDVVQIGVRIQQVHYGNGFGWRVGQDYPVEPQPSSSIDNCPNGCGDYREITSICQGCENIIYYLHTRYTSPCATVKVDDTWWTCFELDGIEYQCPDYYLSDCSDATEW